MHRVSIAGIITGWPHFDQRSMNVLLTTINSKYIHQNLAIRLLYALNKNHEGLSIHEFDSKTNTSEIVEFCSTYNLVAFSCYIWNITQTLEVARKIKQLNPACEILLGGPEVSYDWKEIIALPEIDFIILGEGEIPFSLLLNSYPALDRVPGLVWKKDGKSIENKSPEIFDLQQLQNINPYKSIPAEELQHKICYIEASRGCPNCCEFCLAGLHNKIRYLPLENIHANLLYLIENGRVIKFLDRTFNTHPAFAISIFQFILNHYKPGNIFQFEIKADILQDDLITFIRLHVPKGIFRFEIGIQTLNAKSNHEVKRKQNFDNIKAFIRQITGKIEIHLDLIVGLPHDYLADIKYSFEEVFKLYAPELQLGFLKFLKGTPIRENYQEHAYRFDPLPPYQIIESKYLTNEEIATIMLVEHTLDIYWNKKRALHTLKYVSLTYSIFDFLHGLSIYRKETNGLQNNGLTEIYNTLYEFSMQNYPGNSILQELIALDYYLQHKVKPGIRFLPEISKETKVKIFNTLKLNHHKYRYVIHTVNFSVQKLLNYGIIEPATDLLIIEYVGVDKPRILLQNNQNCD
jgi:anaerobic magnesium-protoporphyrin IX monomethyl ester cyclase